MEGKLKHANSKGYGFIETAAKIDYYFHHTAYQGDWKVLLKHFVSDEAVILEFDNDSEAPSGPRAKNVRMKENS